MASKTYKLRPIAELGHAAMLWLAINIGCEVLRLALSVVDLGLLFNMDRVTAEQWDLWDRVILGSNLLLVPYYICIVVVAVWIYRASTNAHAIGKGLTISPPWAVGWFAIPFANLWKPYESMSETCRVSRNPGGWRGMRSPPEMKVWWASWIIATTTGNVGARLIQKFDDRGLIVFAASLLIVSAVAGIVAGWTLRKLIRDVTTRQSDLLNTQVF